MRQCITLPSSSNCAVGGDTPSGPPWCLSPAAQPRGSGDGGAAEWGGRVMVMPDTRRMRELRRRPSRDLQDKGGVAGQGGGARRRGRRMSGRDTNEREGDARAALCSRVL